MAAHGGCPGDKGWGDGVVRVEFGFEGAGVNLIEAEQQGCVGGCEHALDFGGA